MLRGMLHIVMHCVTQYTAHFVCTAYYVVLHYVLLRYVFCLMKCYVVSRCIIQTVTRFFINFVSHRNSAHRLCKLPQPAVPRSSNLSPFFQASCFTVLLKHLDGAYWQFLPLTKQINLFPTFGEVITFHRRVSLSISRPINLSPFVRLSFSVNFTNLDFRI